MDIIDQTKQKMKKVLDVLKTDLSTVRTGRAMPSLVENIAINAYGGTQRLKVMELATISAQDSQMLIITPFDPSIIGEIQKGIMEANVGFNPSIDGQVIRISIPPLSLERREQLIHLMRQKLENGRVMVRQERHEAMSEIKKQYGSKAISEDEMARFEKEAQKTTDSVISEIEAMGKIKEAELLQI